jgi:hypothetical protein
VSPSEPEFTVSLPLSAWRLVMQQVGEGSINQFLPILTAIQGQLEQQVRPREQTTQAQAAE